MNRFIYRTLLTGVIFYLPMAYSFCQKITLDATKSVDEFTKALTVYVMPKEEIIQRKKSVETFLSVEEEKNTIVSITYYKTEKEEELYRIRFNKSIDLGCVSKYDGKLLVLFEDGETLTLKQQSETECDDAISPFYYFASPETIEMNSMVDLTAEQAKYIAKFLSTDISKARIYGTKFYDEIVFRPETKSIVKDMLVKVEEVLVEN